MKVVMVHRYFWPDTPPYATMLRLIAGKIAKDGHDVTVLSTQPSYKSTYKLEAQPWQEIMDGFTVKRMKVLGESRSNVFLRLISMLFFSIKLFIKLSREKADVVSIATTPQIIGGLVVRLASFCFGAKYVYHCQDIYPEVAIESGHLKKGFVYKVLRYIDKKTCDSAIVTVVLSEDMKDSLLARGCHGNNIQIINNFELVDFGGATSTEPEILKRRVPVLMMRPPERFRVIFAGNIGKFQGLDVVLEAAKLLSDTKKIEFVFLGEGQAKKSLEEQAGALLNDTVKFFGHQSLDIAKQLISDSQLCIVSLSQGVYKYAYPSKTMTYMCQGIPVAVVAELSSELSKTIRSKQLGITVEPGNATDLAEKISNFVEDVSLADSVKQNVQRYSTEKFKVGSVLPLWSKVFGSANS